jgi:hypothetical protein
VQRQKSGELVWSVTLRARRLSRGPCRVQHKVTPRTRAPSRV